ncbi:restriction endonuclease subunit S [Sulfuriferula thiophila]|uniref:restriction endonuclease subunit S n=1 Tax=Sulfuriferula thiophila TaxID=1781211 RepID=UPI000F6154F2|nr:restriction endonuclease subunit S [Sulfuriferula thiophila]
MTGHSSATLGGICRKIGSGATPTGGSSAYQEAGIPLIRSQNVLDFSFSEDGLAFINDDQAFELRNVTVEENDVLLNITGDSVARCCVVPKALTPARVNQHVAIIRPIPEKANHLFIFYLLQQMKEELLMKSEIGATRRALTKGMLENLEIELPPLPEQQAIAAVLSSLDDKIDLLHRQNKTLEAMAETLFRQWFVEEAQEGWEDGVLGDVLDLVYGKALKEETRTGIGFPVVGSSGVVGYHSEYLVEGPGIVIGRKGTLGKVTYLFQNFFPIDTTYYIKSKIGSVGLFYEYCLLKTLSYENSDSAVPGLNRDIALSEEIKLAPKERIQIFNERCAPIFGKLKTNTSQIRTLEKLRDTLLPKLMSGEVRVAV